MPVAPGAPGPGTGDRPSSGGRTGWIVGGAVVAILLVVGAILAAVLAGTGGADIELTIDTCEIAADGSLSASGSIRNVGGDSVEVPVEVEFSDVASAEVVDTDGSTVEVAGDAAERWSAGGSAGDDVERVSCDVTAGG